MFGASPSNSLRGSSRFRLGAKTRAPRAYSKSLLICRATRLHSALLI